MNIRKIISLTLILFTVILTISSCNSAPAEYTRTSFAFDTYVTFRIFKTDSISTPEEICDNAISLLNDLEKKLSTTKDNSEVAKLNNLAATAPVKTDEQIYWLIRNCVDLSTLTNGAFDITLGKISELWGFYSDNPDKPNLSQIASLAGKENYKAIEFDDKNLTISFKNDSFKLDLGAVGKGYALDMLKELFKDSGVTSGLIDFGGSILTIGKYGDGNWTVSISDGTKEGIAGKITLPAAFYSTSNASNRFVEYDGTKYHHIIDGKTAFPSESDIESCTIIGDSGLISDALSTAVFVMGKDNAIALYNEFPVAEFVITDKDGNVYVTDGVESYFESEKNG